MSTTGVLLSSPTSARLRRKQTGLERSRGFGAIEWTCELPDRGPAAGEASLRAGQMDGRMCSSVEVSGVCETVLTIQTRRDGHGAFHTGSISVHHCGWFCGLEIFV